MMVRPLTECLAGTATASLCWIAACKIAVSVARTDALPPLGIG